MSEQNKNVVGRWFKEFWGNPWNPRIIEELAASDIVVHYPMHEPKKGRAAVTQFMTEFRERFRISISGASAISSRKATSSSAAGKAAARTPGQRSATSGSARCPRLRAAR